MKLLLIRHAEAVWESADLHDEGRYLTKEGRAMTRRVGAALREKLQTKPTRMVSSHLVRAVQTAELLADALGYREPIEADPSLAPDSMRLEQLVAKLKDQNTDELQILVGHEPSLPALAATFLKDPSFASFRKCEAAMLELYIDKQVADLQWRLPPS